MCSTISTATARVAVFRLRAAASSLVEFNRQRIKVLAAIQGLNTDVIGLLEVENDGNGANSATADIVNGLNASAGAGTMGIRPRPGLKLRRHAWRHR